MALQIEHCMIVIQQYADRNWRVRRVAELKRQNDNAGNGGTRSGGKL
jgi:hypothetical protein